jgi:hypothetical protein
MSQTRPHRQSYGFADREPALLVDPKITPALVADDRLVRAPCPHAVIFESVPTLAQIEVAMHAHLQTLSVPRAGRVVQPAIAQYAVISSRS